MASIRAPAVAGLFYPDDPATLRHAVEGYLARARGEGAVPKALVAPHAGFVYSGPVAASAYRRLMPAHAKLRRVVLLGPSHRVAFRGLAIPSVAAFATPLGPVPLDREELESIAAMPQVQVRDDAHAQEHSLEVQLPFLQEILDEFELVPIAVGSASAIEVAEVIERLWGGAETLMLVSTDLSHYFDYDTARQLDQATTEAIEALQYERLGPDSACGRVPLGGLLHVARRRGMHAQTLDLRNSGDTAGGRDRVVGYGAYALQ